MKLRREMIDRIGSRMAAALLDERWVEGPDRPALAARLSAALTADLLVEDRLNDEVRELLKQHAGEIMKANVEYHQLFKTLKAKLVRERKLIL